jgi:hypothetical protein
MKLMKLMNDQTNRLILCHEILANTDDSNKYIAKIMESKNLTALLLFLAKYRVPTEKRLEIVQAYLDSF